MLGGFMLRMSSRADRRQRLLHLDLVCSGDHAGNDLFEHALRRCPRSRRIATPLLAPLPRPPRGAVTAPLTRLPPSSPIRRATAVSD